jgi:conjugal transfer pilus assembly protein TraK
MKPPRVKVSVKAGFAAGLSLLVFAAHATSILELHDGGSATAKISLKDPTRIKVEGAHITDVLGSSVRTEKNPLGTLTVSTDETKGEIYLQPTGAKLAPATSIFVSTDQATYTLVLVPLDIPADTLVIRDRGIAVAQAAKRLPNHERELINLLKSLAADVVPAGLQATEMNKPVALWKETRFTLMRRYEGHPRWIIDAYQLTNVTETQMVIDEREFLTEGVAAVGLEQTILAPNEAAIVRIVREAK